VVARQRPATAKGVTFMLLEDEHGTINLIVPPPVHERCRLAVRGEALVIADGRLERREGVTNVLVHDVRRLERGDLPSAEVRHIEPRRIWSTDSKDSASLPNPSHDSKDSASLPDPSRESGEVIPGTPGASAADLAAAMPAANSFGRGRR